MAKSSLYLENELLQSIAKGDESAFREIVIHYQDVIYSVAFRLTRDRAMAEDILQDTFMKVWLKKEMLPSIDNFGGWIYRIAHNQIMNALKKISIEKKVNNSLRSIEAFEQRLSFERVELKDIELIIDKAVQNLPEKQEQAYRLIKVKGLSREEASRILGVSPETVKSNLDHAMRFIRAFCMKRLDHGLIFIIPVLSFL